MTFGIGMLFDAYFFLQKMLQKYYSNRLKNSNLPTLKYRHYRGDMIELFKIIKGNVKI